MKRYYISKEKPKMKREHTVLRLTCREYSSTEIGSRMGISRRMVEKIRLDLLRKAKAKNVIGLAKYAIKNEIYLLKVPRIAHKRVFENLITMKPKLSTIQKLVITREFRVLKLVCQEYNSSEIANKVGLSKKRVDGIRLGLLRKTKSKNTVGLLKYAIKNSIYILK